MTDPKTFGIYFMSRWESSKHSTDKDDPGNFFKGALIGSTFGVTGAALAKHRKTNSITFTDMANLKIEEAADIFLADYYYAPNLHLLPWNRVTASIVDFGWGAGPQQSIKLLQRMLDAPTVDGIITPGGATIAKYTALTQSEGEVFMAGAWWTTRDCFYELIIDKDAIKAKFEKGWDNRSFDYTPRSDWWKAW